MPPSASHALEEPPRAPRAPRALAATAVLGPVLGALLGALPFGAPARAEDARAEASAIFRRASEAFRKGDHFGAADGFERAHAHAPSAAALYNAARAWQAAGEPARAADRFTDALARPGLDPAKTRDARRQLATLERGLGQVTIVGSRAGSVSVAHVADAPMPVTVHVPVGTARLRVTWADGGRSEREVPVARGERLRVFVEAPPPSTAAPAHASAGAGTPRPPTAAGTPHAPVPGVAPPGSAPATSAAPPAGAPPAAASPVEGLRFFLRLGLGLGGLNDQLEQSFEPGLQAVGKASGGVLDSDLVIGVSINRHLVFALAAPTAWVSRPKVSFPKNVDPDLAGVGAGAFVVSGPLVDWYFADNRGWHVQAMIGAARLELADARGTRIDTRISGSALGAGVGYDWWLAGRWRWGTLLRLTFSSLAAERTKHNLFLGSLLLTTTWDLRGPS